MEKGINLNVQETQHTQTRNIKKTISSCILVTLLKSKDEETTLQRTQSKRTHYTERNNESNNNTLTIRNNKSRKRVAQCPISAERKTCQCSSVYPVKIFFKNEGDFPGGTVNKNWPARLMHTAGEGEDGTN